MDREGRESNESTIENCGGIDEAKWFFQEINTPEIYTKMDPGEEWVGGSND